MAINRDLKNRILGNLILLTIAIILVAGFWFHGEFYQIGLPALLFVGVIAVFLIIKGASLALKGYPTFMEKGGEIKLSSLEIKLILEGRKDIYIGKLGNSGMRIGKYLEFYASDERYKAKVKILNIYRKRLSSLTISEIRRNGYKTIESLAGAWESLFSEWNDKEIVKIVEFELLEGAS